MLTKTQTGSAIPGQSGFGSYGNEGVIYTHQSFRTGASSSDAYIQANPGNTFLEGGSYPSVGIIVWGI